MPDVFKAGKWNPETEIVEEEIEKCGNSKEPEYSCCKICNMRNLHRAIEIGDATLLKRLVMDKKNIPNMLSSWSANDKQTILAKIVGKNSLTLLESLYPTEGWQGKMNQGQAVDQRQGMVEFYGDDREKSKDYLLHKINTGKVNRKAYGTNIRSVQMTRGNRQGNMAFEESGNLLSGYLVPLIAN